LYYCSQAIWCRFRYGVTNFYYVPAPGKPVALYRDWLVMFLCRPFFKHVILHWHAAGLARWLETEVSLRTRSLTYRFMKNVDASIVLSEFNRRDAEKLFPARIVIVSGCRPDPCPRFADDILPRRRERVAEQRKILLSGAAGAGDAVRAVNVLFLAHCMREKGLFDAIEGVVLANERLAARKSPLRFRLTLIGAFAFERDKEELDKLIRQRGLEQTVEYLGFVSTERKEQALRDADLFCFPTYHGAENQPGNLIEAMAFGLPAVTTRWRSIPEMLPPDYPGLVDPKSPAQIAEALERVMVTDLAEQLRETFTQRFTLEQHLTHMSQALRSVEE
jgi:glycosyltransferase involved in cell wall biosynthesis